MQPVSSYRICTEGRLNDDAASSVGDPYTADGSSAVCKPGRLLDTVPPCTCLSIDSVEESLAGSVPYAGISGRGSIAALASSANRPFPCQLKQAAPWPGFLWAGLVKNPVDRTAAVRAAFESLGGKLEVLYYTFGADDFIVIGEVPDQIQAAAVGIAVASTGRYRDLRTLPLLTAEEIVQALQAAGTVSFRPAGT